VSHAFKQYLAERFPVGPYALLVAAMTAGATAAACQGQDHALMLGGRQFVAFLALMLGFFHLRVFDEHKDFEKDCVAHPERVLSRGVITLVELRRAGRVAIVLGFAAAAPLGLHPLLWWMAVVLFSLAMKVEFGIGDWLNRHIVIYALTHNPIVALMMLFVMVVITGETTVTGSMVLYILLATFSSLAFEIGRKVRAPEDEKEGQDTYTKALGIPPTVALLAVLLVLSGGVASAMVSTPWAGLSVFVLAVLAIGLVFRFVFSSTSRGAKKVEAATTFFALLLYLIVAVDVACSHGVEGRLW
jgi:4-hydroxybenzoate polyprenyltransferase